MVKRKSKRWGKGNPLWEWQQRNKGKKTKTTKRSRSKGENMARRKSYRRGKSGGNLLSGKGLLGAKIGMGVIGAAAAGLIGAEIAKRVVPNNTLASGAIGFLMGGPVGAATAYFMPNGISSVTGLMGGATSSNSSIPMYP